MNLIKIILTFIAVSLGLFLMIEQIKLITRRYFFGYNKEIDEYLKQNKLTFYDSRFPNNLDWKRSPFTKPNTSAISLSSNIKMMGIQVTWNKKEYKLIETQEGISLWLEISTTYFKKPKLVFRSTH